MGFWNKKSEEEQYLETHPDSTLKEYIDFLKEEQKKKKLFLDESKKRHEELLNSYIGKCFKVNFNGSCVIYFKITTPITQNTLVTSYELYTDKDRTYMSLDTNRYINERWLPNQEEWYSSSYVQSSSIISEESFNKIVSMYENMVESVKEIKNIVK